MQAPNTPLLLLIVAMLACCGPSTEEKVFRELARRVNPALTAMRTTALAITSTRADDYDGIVEKCSAADESLRVLRDIHVEVPTGPSIKRIAGELLDDRDRRCRRNSQDWYKWCGDFCRERWLSLIKEVDVLRAAADKLGVEIVSISP